jgi:hypothetical protein
MSVLYLGLCDVNLAEITGDPTEGFCNPCECQDSVASTFPRSSPVTVRGLPISFDGQDLCK